MKNYKPYKFYLGIYLFWIFLHMLLWMNATKSKISTNLFFPFGDSPNDMFEIDRIYDWSEFLFYSISPPIIYFAYNLIIDAYENHRYGNDDE